MYNRSRLWLIVFLFVSNSSCALGSVAQRRYPVGLAGVLLLIPCLLRELDRAGGNPPRKLGSFEWSCLLAALLFLAALPLFV
jgi:hypothetical protein